jgi:hypothetical protein
MTSIKYFIIGPNGKYLQANGEFDNPIETSIQFSSLEEVVTYTEQYLSSDLYSVVTYIVKS